MPNPIQIKRGTKASLPTLAAGELAFTTDTFELFCGTGSANKFLGGGPGATLPDASVSQAKLKTSFGDVWTNTNANVTLPGGEYGFFPQHYRVTGAAHHCYIAQNATNSSFVTSIYMTGGSGSEAYARQRYVTSSGEVFWLFYLRDKKTKGNLIVWGAPDHPCFGNGGKPLLVEHPFLDFNEAKHEIVVVNPTAAQVAEIMALQVVADERTPDRSFLDVLMTTYEIDESSKPQWTEKDVTVGLVSGHDWARMQGKDNATIKKKIPHPTKAIHKVLKRK